MLHCYNHLEMYFLNKNFHRPAAKNMTTDQSMYPENMWTCWGYSQLLVKPIQTGEDFSAKIKSVFVPASLAGLLAFFEI